MKDLEKIVADKEKAYNRKEETGHFDRKIIEWLRKKPPKKKTTSPQLG